MPVNIITCPNCGAPVAGSGQRGARRCAYCGTPLQVSPEGQPQAAPPISAAELEAKRARLAWLRAHPLDPEADKKELRRLSEKVVNARKGVENRGCCAGIFLLAIVLLVLAAFEVLGRIPDGLTWVCLAGAVLLLVIWAPISRGIREYPGKLEAQKREIEERLAGGPAGYDAEIRQLEEDLEGR